MRRPIFLIAAITTLSLIGVGFIIFTFDPFEAPINIKVLFLAASFLALTGIGTVIFYRWEVFKHKQFANVFFPRALRRGILIAFLCVGLLVLGRTGLMSINWLVGTIVITGMIEFIAMKAFKPL